MSDREYRIIDLPYLPGWLRITMCVVPAFLLFAPFVVRNRCRVQVGISKQVRNRYLLRKLIAGLLIIGSLFSPIVLVVLNQTAAAVVVANLFPLLFWGGFILLILFSSPLKIHQHVSEHFWLDGCSSEFLESLKASADEASPPSAVT